MHLSKQTVSPNFMKTKENIFELEKDLKIAPPPFFNLVSRSNSIAKIRNLTKKCTDNQDNIINNCAYF